MPLSFWCCAEVCNNHPFKAWRRFCTGATAQSALHTGLGASPPAFSAPRQELAHLGGAAAHVATTVAAGGASGGPHLWAAAGALRVLHLLVERGAMGVPAGFLPHLRALQARPEVRCTNSD